VPTSPRRARKVDDQATASNSRDAAGEEPVRRLRDRVGAQRLGDPGSVALDHLARRLGRDVAWPQAGATCGEDEPGLFGQLRERVGDRVRVVGNDAPLDLVAVALE